MNIRPFAVLLASTVLIAAVTETVGGTVAQTISIPINFQRTVPIPNSCTPDLITVLTVQAAHPEGSIITMCELDVHYVDDGFKIGDSDHGSLANCAPYGPITGINVLSKLDSQGVLAIELYDATEPESVPEYNAAVFEGTLRYTYEIEDPELPPPDDDSSEGDICPQEDSCDDPDDVEECPYHPVGCSSCSSHGSPRPAFHPATFNLQINDTPIWHETAVGPKLAVDMRFSNFAATNARTSFGAKWGSNWDSYLLVENAQTNRVRLPSGSVVGFTAQGASTWAPPASLSGTMVLTNGVYQYRKVNGEVLHYAQSSGNPNVYLLARMWDAWSNTVAITYTADRIHRVTQIVPDTGNYLEFAYNGADTKATSVMTRAEAQRIATYHYNSSGFLTNIVDMSDFGYVYTYTNGFISGIFKGSPSGLRRLGVHYTITPDAWTATNSHRVTMTDSEDRVMTYTWAFGLVLKDVAFQGITNREIYQVAANPHRKAVVTSHANARTFPIQFTYNVNARLIERVDRTGATWSYSRNGAHRITSITDPHDNVWSNVYAANGIDLLYQIPPTGPIQRVFTYVPDLHVPATESNALGRVITYCYNALGLLTNRHDGRTTNTYLHDTTGRLVSHLRNGDLVQTNRYDLFGRRVWTMNASGLIVTNAYDDLNRLISETYITPDGQTTREIEYDCCAISRITDRKGRDTYFQYNDLGWKLSEENPAGLVTTWTYERNGQPTTISNLLQWETRQYTEEGWLKRRELPIRPYGDLHAENFWYDEQGRLLKKQGLAGEFYRYDYDLEGRQTGAFVPDGATLPVGVEDYVQSVSNRYDALGRIVWTRDIRGLIVTNAFNALDQITTTYYPDQSTEAWTYNPWGDVTSYKDRAGNITSNVYDHFGRLTRQIDPLNVTNYTTYTNLHLVAAISNSLGQAWKYTHDVEGRVTKIVHPDLTEENIAYDSLGNVTQHIRGAVTTVTAYNELDRPVSIHVNSLLVQSNRYDALGRVEWSRDADGLIITNAWDTWSDLMSRHWPQTLAESFQYGDRGLTNATDRLGIPMRYQRDTLGRIIHQVDGATNTLSFAYHPDGLLHALADANNNQTAWTYDLFGNMTNKTYADASADRYHYDRLNRVTNKLDAAGIATRYTYDPNGNLLTLHPGNQPAIAFAYDPLNRRTNMTDGVGTTRWTHDAMNRLTSEAGPFGTTVAVSYDSLGRLTNATLSGHTWTYQYDGLSRITNILAPEGVYRLGYHEQGRRKTSLRYPHDILATFGYDVLIRMTNLAYSLGASNLLAIAYQYDAGDRRTNETWTTGRSIGYGYDRAHQLLDALSAADAADTASYRYDKAGNPLRRTELGLGVTNSFNNLNQILSGVSTGGLITVAGAVNYNAGAVTVNGVTADRTGLYYERPGVVLTTGTNLITAVYHGPGFTNHPNIVTAQTQVVVGQTAYTHDPNGNLTADAAFHYRYDALNQLTNVVSQHGGTNHLANRYDGLGRRIQATTSGTNIVRYLYLPGSFLVLATLDADNNLLETFTHGPDLSGTLGGAGGIGGILSQTKHQGQSTTHFLHSDAMGNVVMTTDGSGNISSTYRYTPFGRQYAKTGPFTSRFTFSSKEFDASTGLGYWGYRFYSPGLGRWLNRDPIGEVGGVYLYLFIGNNPFTWIDSYGLEKLYLNYDFEPSSTPIRFINVKNVSSFTEIAIDAKEKVGKHHPQGEDPCNCIQRIRIGGHGGEGSFVGRKHGAPSPENSLNDIHFRFYRDVANRKSEAEAAQRFPNINAMNEIAKLLCDDGVIEFVSCHTCVGERGQNLMDRLEDIFGPGRVRGHEGAVRWGPLGGVHPVSSGKK